MLTQQNLMDRLNQLMLDHNVAWRDIRYDADKAIDKINSFMGTKYPKLSSILISPESTYTFRSDGVDIEYFPEEYMHSVVIPYIATEILARAEEFTTIYNKYLAEIDDGLFTMFQKEFNRVPLAYRQDPDRGVFFASDNALAAIAHNTIDEADLPVYKFHVAYHINNQNIILPSGVSFVEDIRAYLYEDTYIIKGWNQKLLSSDGTKAYTFIGWSRNPNEVTEDSLVPGASFTIMTDVNLYAVWEEESTLNITVDGIVTIKDEFIHSITALTIPDIINGVIVRTIPTNFLKHTTELNYAEQLEVITLPNYITTIQTQAFKGFGGSQIILPETPISITYAGISIATLAFEDTPSLESIILPTNITDIANQAFPIVGSKQMVIYCRALEQNKPDGWLSGWYTGASYPYGVTVVWGYNV